MVKKNSTKHDQYTVVLEDLRSEFRVFGEGLAVVDRKVGNLNDKVDGLASTLESHTGMIGQIMLDLHTIKGDLKRKVNYEDFVRLEKRVGKIEVKLSH